MTETLERPVPEVAAPLRRRRSWDPISIGLRLGGIAVYAFLFLPIIVIVAYSFNNGRILAAWHEFGFSAYTSAFSNVMVKNAALTSLQAACGAAVLSTVLGTLGGLALARSRNGNRWAAALTAILAITLVTPEVMTGVSLLPWFVSLGTDAGFLPMNNGLVRLVIAHTVMSVAVVTFIIRARMQGTDLRLEEAAADLYASRWNAFRQITLPLAFPGILAGALMSFTLSLDNTIVSSFVQLPGSTPWPVYIFSSLKVGLRPEVAAVSTLMLVLTLIALGVVAFVLRRSGAGSQEIASTLAGG
ncbi:MULTISPECIES: ABC transporter permease [unclassified Mycolicibacterium]|uniref:ABC transporter permease n=1 Tax=unclassified Mycolicibacterium TaxID=2636767 RepID=UPI0012DDED68|nr:MULTISPECIES: ABC transporter permease [unclassified Mycolicibacterium]MUL81436.1 ABC transporter permease [Mycolicibacterium sp. CBMA 329]MUL87202.1 ABC transporter permease [Mycolicibacterium sp. CBMA 331]MUL98516.1 ABC transporter permease [Mycolicibacterium sp. CBMA 334]MUM25270.1 ABC transporter permease [Mycolicibacterium sp. CBMA 295]MUM37499.1 ABC transporter permease [Mycolicibacterium sp. CBMA 247]